MKLSYSEEWYDARIDLEGDSEVGAGTFIRADKQQGRPAVPEEADPKPEIVPDRKDSHGK
jgi:hypothetical protein